MIDEYPYLAQSNPEISSLLQDKIDHLYKETRLMLILCGSSLSFMEEQVLGYESPLYGRRTAQFKIMPLDFTTTLGLWQIMGREDAAVCYGMTGGIPAYIEKSILPHRSRTTSNVFFLLLRAISLRSRVTCCCKSAATPNNMMRSCKQLLKGARRSRRLRTLRESLRAT